MISLNENSNAVSCVKVHWYLLAASLPSEEMRALKVGMVKVETYISTIKRGLPMGSATPDDG